MLSGLLRHLRRWNRRSPWVAAEDCGSGREEQLLESVQEQQVAGRVDLERVGGGLLVESWRWEGVVWGEERGEGAEGREEVGGEGRVRDAPILIFWVFSRL